VRFLKPLALRVGKVETSSFLCVLGRRYRARLEAMLVEESSDWSPKDILLFVGNDKRNILYHNPEPRYHLPPLIDDLKPFWTLPGEEILRRSLQVAISRARLSTWCGYDIVVQHCE
jgi:hypothetical protein